MIINHVNRRLLHALLCASGPVRHEEPQRRVHVLVSLLWDGLIPGEAGNPRPVHGQVPPWRQ